MRKEKPSLRDKLTFRKERDQITNIVPVLAALMLLNLSLNIWGMTNVRRATRLIEKVERGRTSETGRTQEQTEGQYTKRNKEHSIRRGHYGEDTRSRQVDSLSRVGLNGPELVGDSNMSEEIRKFLVGENGERAKELAEVIASFFKPEKEEIKLCRQCGSAVQASMTYCTECGTSVKEPTRECGDCSMLLNNRMKFCPRCGKKVTTA